MSGGCARVVLTGLCSVLAGGCISTGTRVICADEPDTITGIQRFELKAQEVIVHGGDGCFRLVGPDDREGVVVSVRPNESFRANGWNCTEWWKLVELDSQEARFTVRGRYYGCTDPFAIFLGIPSRTSRWNVIIKPPVEENGGTTPAPTRWF